MSGHIGVSSSLIDVAAHSFVDAAPVSASVTVAVTVISSAAVLAVAPSYTIAYETCVSAGTATEASGRSGPEIRLNLPMFALVTESVPPFGPPLATMLRRVRVEFLPTHRPGSFSYASSKMTADFENEAETEAARGAEDGPHFGPVPS